MRINLYEQRQLWLPLINTLAPFPAHQDIKKLNLPKARTERSKEKWDRHDSFGADYWENEDILRCHAYLLEKSAVDLLCPRTSAGSKLEIIEWMNDDSSRGRPFSFRMCCELFDADHEIVRKAIFGQLEQPHTLLH